jgi:hypothetical protein
VGVVLRRKGGVGSHTPTVQKLGTEPMAQRIFCAFYSPVSMAATQSTVFDVFGEM